MGQVALWRLLRRSACGRCLTQALVFGNAGTRGCSLLRCFECDADAGLGTTSCLRLWATFALRVDAWLGQGQLEQMPYALRGEPGFVFFQIGDRFGHLYGLAGTHQFLQVLGQQA